MGFLLVISVFLVFIGFLWAYILYRLENWFSIVLYLSFYWFQMLVLSLFVKTSQR